MPVAAKARYQFIGHALRGDGPFRPEVGTSTTVPTLTGETYLVRYPRESDAKFVRRNEIAFFASPLARACSRFAGYISTRAPQREMPHDLFTAISDDADGKGNAIDVLWQSFMVDAKARGAMLLLVNMATDIGQTQSEQIALRKVPYWSPIAPELLEEYQVGEDGKFDFVEFLGIFRKPDDTQIECTWRLDRSSWEARDDKDAVLASGSHPLGECPVLIFTERGSFPTFGPFSDIADLSRRLFNLDSELDEILRSQTFSLLTMPVPDGSTDQQKLGAAKVAGETIGTHNLLVHNGSTPAFIAPPDGPAKVYLERIKDIRNEIDAVGLNVATVNQQESGIAMQLRFQTINAELSRFAARMEDLERRAWEMSRKWLNQSKAPVAQWPRDFNVSDVEQELRILSEMQAAAMPVEVIAEQQRRVVAVQFVGLEADRADAIEKAIDERAQEKPLKEPEEETT